jgi:hypothetical protein
MTFETRPSTIPVAVITAAQIDAVISRRPILSSLQPAMLGYHQRCGIQARSDVGRDRVGAELRVEAVLLTMLVFLGVNVAWLLLFDEAQSPSALEDPTRPHALRHACIAAVTLSSLLQLDLTALLLECSRRWLYQAPCGAGGLRLHTGAPPVGRSPLSYDPRLPKPGILLGGATVWASIGSSARWRWPGAPA